jgi:hypothetical protein
LASVDPADSIATAALALRDASSPDALSVATEFERLLRAYATHAKATALDGLADQQVAADTAEKLADHLARQVQQYNPPCTCHLFPRVSKHVHDKDGCQGENYELAIDCMCHHRG